VITLVVCTRGSKSFSVLRQSIAAYAADLVTIRPYCTDHSTFGEAYNYAMADAFQDCSEMLIANDDIVLTPSTIQTLLEDVKALKLTTPRLGLVGTWSDNVRGLQSIKKNPGNQIKRTHTLSPILAWVSKRAFTAAQFPPLNWYSDDVLCEDLTRLGFEHYISRAYVHHVGSATIGPDDWKNYHDALPWLWDNRPEYATRWNLKDRGENV